MPANIEAQGASSSSGSIFAQGVHTGQLQNLYEKAMRKTFDKRNFRKKLFKSKLLIDLEKKSDGSGYGQHKGSLLFSFNAEAYSLMKLKGYDFVF